MSLGPAEFHGNEQVQNMLRGDLYDPLDADLDRMRRDMQQKQFDYASIPPTKPAERLAAVKDIIGITGKNAIIEPPCFFDYGKFVTVGENFYANFGCVFLDGGYIEMGDDVMLAPGVQIYTAHHPLDSKLRYSGLELCNKVVIGDRVWVGGQAIINPGVTIGSDVVIGSGSVVTKNIPSNSVVAGNPARVIRRLDEGGKNDTAEYQQRQKSRGPKQDKSGVRDAEGARGGGANSSFVAATSVAIALFLYSAFAASSN